MTFDSLTYARRLKASGFTDQQAETLADATRDIFVQDFTANFATKADLAAVEQRLSSRIDGVEQRLDSRIDGVEQRLDSRIDTLEQRLTAAIDGQALRLIVRLGSMLIVGFGLMTAVLGLLIRAH